MRLIADGMGYAGCARVGLRVLGRPYRGVILDFAGVLTSNMVEVFDLFEARERVPPGRFLRA